MKSEPTVRRKPYRRDPEYKKRKILTIAAIVLGVAAVFVVIVVLFALHYVRKMNYVPLDPEYTILAEVESETANEPETLVEETSREETDEKSIEEYQKAAEAALEELGLSLADAQLDNVYNVLLIGSDARPGGWSARSDTVMLLSVNFDTNKITLTSFLRDLYVYIPQREVYDKLNSAYQYGGVELLIETIRYNFSIEVDRYISVDFYAFMDVVDVIGGLDITVEEEELYWLNMYIHANNELLGCDEFDGLIEEADGSAIHMNGKQALAYARFRYVGNGDFSRTERQRKVLNIAYEKLKHTSPDKLVELLDVVLPQITTNIPESEALGLLARVPEMSTYSITNWGIPDDQYVYITVDSVSSLGIDFKYYVTRLYSLIYGNVILGETGAAQ